MTGWIRAAGRSLAAIAVNSLAASPLAPRVVRWAILRGCGLDVMAWNISPRCFFGGVDVKIGRGTYVNRGCVFDALAPIEIGDNCALGIEVMLLTSFHDLGGTGRRAGALRSAPVSLGNGCWLGSRAVVLPGVRIGDGVVIAAGAVVTRDCAADGVYAGVPARRVRSLQ